MHPSSRRLNYIKCTPEGLTDYLNFGMNEAVMHYVAFGALNREKSVERYNAALAINKQNTPFGYWMAYAKSNKELIVYLKIIDLGNGQHEVGYLVLPDHWGKGYATEVTAALIEYAKEMTVVTELVGIVNSKNGASKKVLTKNGFEYYNTEKEEQSIEEYFRLFI